MGIRITWASLDDPSVAGYHLYKSNVAIPDTARGDSLYWVPVIENASTGGYVSDIFGEPFIPQPLVPGTITVDNLFPVAIGEEYFYRVTAVDVDGDESRLSGETQVTITQFQITQLQTTSAGVGDFVTINGERFGQYSPDTDAVTFPGVEWVDASGFQPVEIPAVIDSWTPTQIIAVVPPGATTGQPRVSISGASQPTPETFINSDPYITEIAPISGNVQTQLFVRGANFGASLDSTHFVVLGGVDITEPNQYAAYSDTEIELNPPYTGAFGRLDLLVSSNGSNSNSGAFTLQNLPPTARLTPSATVALAPATITLDASATTDPEHALDVLVFDYDWEGDGVYDVLDAGPTPPIHRYNTPGDYLPTVRVTDPEGATDAASAPLTIVNQTNLTDNGSPGPGNYYESDGELQLDFRLAGGLGPYTIDWILRDSTGILPDTRIAQDSVDNAGAYNHRFTIDSSTGTPEEDSNKLPLGAWLITVSVTDSTTVNDPDSSITLPTTTGTYNIYRYRAVVVQDIEGDPGGTVAQSIYDMLLSKGYDLPPTPLASDSIDISNLLDTMVVVWAADGPHGTVTPFEWLGLFDTTLMRTYLDLGGNLVVLGPASLASPTPFPADNDFNADYQPFIEVIPVLAVPDVTIYPQDFTSIHTTLVSSLVYTGAYGKTVDSGLYPNALNQMVDTAEPGPGEGAIAAIRPSPSAGGGNLYFGQFTFANITSFDPSGVVAADLLDNIAAGTITY